MKLICFFAALSFCFNAFAESARQYRTCSNASDTIRLQLFAGPGSYGDTASDVFGAWVKGIEYKALATALSEEKLISRVVEDEYTTVITTSIALELELENETKIQDSFICTEVRYVP
ncbi:hypothetical protein AZI86_12525 [Bdellovibrio bacteriovorus]|uniref:Uncharacterized protein n=1 Tax=Bdellovibrio bacteriovorus TaxID=959 RepID=A0A150WIS1_BDEBC|nr:hypothetical protein [Bdellovibrio bacteriovorus]KYG63649.1 hypothetical protein AZI86_12525 [Bdellovibrio bacteriovorus]